MEKAIEIKDLVKRYRIGPGKPSITAVEGLSFQVPKGNIFGLLGPNGAGKTTTLKTILGFIYPDEGEILINGKSYRDITVKNQIGFLSEHPYFYQYHTAEGALDFYARLFKIPRKTRKDRIERLLDMVNLSAHRKMVLKKLSKGMLQRLGIAQALLNDPDILILDEPASGLDPHGQIEIRNLIMSLGNQGKTILLSSHQLSEVEKVCGFIAIIDKGKLIESGSTKELTQDEGSYLIKIKEKDVKAEEMLKELKSEIVRDGESLSLKVKKESLNDALDIVKKADAEIISITPYQKTLEDLFLELTEGN